MRSAIAASRCATRASSVRLHTPKSRRRSAIEAQERFGYAGIVGREVSILERWQIEIGEERILQHPLQPRCILIAVIDREFSDIDPIGLRQAEKQVGCERPLVALDQRHVRWRDIEILRHSGLGEAKVAPQMPHPRTM
jgi:hypothetical protein